MIKYINTPLNQLKSQIIEQFGITLLLKREDQNHPYISGNKWWKLKYNLDQAIKEGANTLLTFGGAYSNHIYATAAAAQELGLRSIGVIRGEETFPLNNTLNFSQACGMHLHFVSREIYRDKMNPELIKQLESKFGKFYLIPEGGTNELAVKGVKEFAEKINEEIDFDFVCLPVGTGGTLAGIMQGLSDSKKVIGFPVLKGADFLEEEISKYTAKKNWQLVYDYHFGGYAKTTSELIQFIEQFENEFNVPLDPIYTAKMMFGVFDLIKKSYFKRESTILLIHTGGLQGRTHLTK